MKKKQVPSSAFSFQSGDVTLDAQGGENHPVTLTALSGEPLDHWWWGQVVHDLDGMRHKESIMIDWCHSDDEPIGFVDNFSTEGGQLTLGGQITPIESSTRPNQVIEFAQKGIPFEASIAFMGSKPGDTRIEELKAGDSAEVNGRTVNGPITIFRQWPLRRVAICPSGADGDTAAAFKDNQEQTVEVEIMAASAEKPEATPQKVEQKEQKPDKATELTVQPIKVEEKPDRKEFTQFVEAFGDELGPKYFGESKTFAEAQIACMAELRAQNEQFKADLEMATKTPTTPNVPFDGSSGEQYDKFWTEADEKGIKSYIKDCKGVKPDFDRLKSATIERNKKKAAYAG